MKISKSRKCFAPPDLPQSPTVEGANHMNWEAISAIGEIFDAPAVLITLVYLATQVRDAKQATADQIELCTTGSTN